MGYLKVLYLIHLCWKPLTVIIKLSILDVVAALGSPLVTIRLIRLNILIKFYKYFTIRLKRLNVLTIRLNVLIKGLEEVPKELFKWFDDNLMKSNPSRCHLDVSTNDNVATRIGYFQIENTKREQLLGIQCDNKPSFDYHLSEICKKALAEKFML